MPGKPRCEIVVEGEVGVYHCWSRCVRRAFLCGVDERTGRNFDHRRSWLREMQELFAGLFGVEVAFHAEMSNHFHLVLRTRPDIVKQWSDEQVIERAMKINLLIRSEGKIREVLPEEIAVRAADPNRVARARKDLSSVSRFMGALCEYVSRRANREDGCTGRFWEGRFQCKSLEDEAAILACGIYVDMNPVRSGEVKDPVEALYTSARDRDRRADRWLCELQLQEGLNVNVETINRACPAAQRASNKGLLPISVPRYLELLQCTAASIQTACPDLADKCITILNEFGIRSERWVETISAFERKFGSIVGRSEAIANRVIASQQRWCWGQRACEATFG